MGFPPNFAKNGYTIARGVFDPDTLRAARDAINAKLEKDRHKLMTSSGGVTIPDFIATCPDLAPVAALKDHPRLHAVLRHVFGGMPYRFCSHNDIGINRTVGWHKDKLNGAYAAYETLDVWGVHGPSGATHHIVKALIYLQDHADNDDALIAVPGSHLRRRLSSRGAVRLHPRFGDVVVFDQRLSHAGQPNRPKNETPKHRRMLVSFGFGASDNLFTDNFERGTVARQNTQNGIPVPVS